MATLDEDRFIGITRLDRIDLDNRAANFAIGIVDPAYRRCGFEVEGRLRQTLWRDGAWHDDLVMAVLEPDFRQAVEN